MRKPTQSTHNPFGSAAVPLPHHNAPLAPRQTPFATPSQDLTPRPSATSSSPAFPFVSSGEPDAQSGRAFIFEMFLSTRSVTAPSRCDNSPFAATMFLRKQIYPKMNQNDYTSFEQINDNETDDFLEYMEMMDLIEALENEETEL